MITLSALIEEIKEDFRKIKICTDLKMIYSILSSIVRTFLFENDAEILHAHYTWKVAFTNLIHKQSIQVKL